MREVGGGDDSGVDGLRFVVWGDICVCSIGIICMEQLYSTVGDCYEVLTIIFRNESPRYESVDISPRVRHM